MTGGEGGNVVEVTGGEGSDIVGVGDVVGGSGGGGDIIRGPQSVQSLPKTQSS